MTPRQQLAEAMLIGMAVAGLAVCLLHVLTRGAM